MVNLIILASAQVLLLTHAMSTQDIIDFQRGFENWEADRDNRRSDGETHRNFIEKGNQDRKSIHHPLAPEVTAETTTGEMTTGAVGAIMDELTTAAPSQNDALDVGGINDVTDAPDGTTAMLDVVAVNEGTTVALDLANIADRTTVALDVGNIVDGTTVALDVGGIADGTTAASVGNIADEETTAAPEPEDGVSERKIMVTDTCQPQFWDTDKQRRALGTCRFMCHCRDGADCKDDGSCPGTNPCPPGYEGSRCETPICTVSCGPPEIGVCTQHNICTCTGHYVKDEVEVEHENGTLVVGHRCQSVRIKGLKGFVAALVILIVSISLCGCIQHTSEKRFHNGQTYAYINNN